MNLKSLLRAPCAQYSTHEPERETDGWGTRDRIVLPSHHPRLLRDLEWHNLQPRYSRLMYMLPICSRYL